MHETGLAVRAALLLGSATVFSELQVTVGASVGTGAVARVAIPSERTDTDPGVPAALPLTASSASMPVRARPLRNRAILLELSGTNPGAVFSVHQSGIVIGRAEASNVVVNDGGVSWEHAALTNRHDGYYVEDLRSLNGTFINEARVDRPVLLADGDQLRLGGSGTVYKFSMMGEFEETVLRNLFSLTLRDSLTHLFNRHHFEERLRGELPLAKREGETLSLLTISIDHFKTVNTGFGRPVVDAVLKLVAGTLLKLTRPDDVVARLEGGMFAVALRATSARNALLLAERVCHRVSAISLEPNVRGLALTVSVGLANVDSTDHALSADALLSRAQQAAREASAGGGNRTRVWV